VTTTPFSRVTRVGLAFPGVEAVTRYDGAPVLKLAGVFMAGLATHESAEPDTLVIRADPDERQSFIEDAPDAYYLTDYYRRYPLVLVRLAQVSDDALRELLMLSYRLTLPKTRFRVVRPRRQQGGEERRGEPRQPCAGMGRGVVRSETEEKATRSVVPTRVSQTPTGACKERRGWRRSTVGLS
jgi:hypothetical protein